MCSGTVNVLRGKTGLKGSPKSSAEGKRCISKAERSSSSRRHLNILFIPCAVVVAVVVVVVVAGDGNCSSGGGVQYAQLQRT